MCIFHHKKRSGLDPILSGQHRTFLLQLQYLQNFPTKGIEESAFPRKEINIRFNFFIIIIVGAFFFARKSLTHDIFICFNLSIDKLKLHCVGRLTIAQDSASVCWWCSNHADQWTALWWLLAHKSRTDHHYMMLHFFFDALSGLYDSKQLS